jgi:hypothetical protein
MSNGFMSPVPSPLDFDPNIPGGYAVPTAVLGSTPGSAQASTAVLGSAPVATPAPAPAPPQGRTGLDYLTFGGASAAQRLLERVGAATMGIDTSAPVAAPAAAAPQATGVGVLPLSQLPQSFSGVGAQYAPPLPAEGPSAAPVAQGAPMAAPAAAAPPRGAQGAGAGVPDSFMGVDLRGAKRAAAGLGQVSEVGGIQMGALTGERKALEERAGRLTEATTEAEANLAKAQQAEQAVARERETLAGQQAEAARVAEEDAAIERQTRRLAAEDAAKKLESAQTALDETKIDVDKAYGGAAGRIFAGLAVALGSFGASLTGGPNYAMQIVNDRINRELDAQRSELDKAKGKVSELGRILQKNEDLLGDATKARNLARAQTFTALAADVEARAKGRELAPQQAKVVADLRARAAAEMDQLQAGIRETQTKAQLIPAVERQQRAQAAFAAKAAAGKEERDIRKAAILESIKQGNLTIDPTTGNLVRGAGSPEQQEKLIGRTTALVKTLDEKNLITGPQSMAELMQSVGVDPTTGTRNPNANVAGFAFGRTNPMAISSDAREIRRKIVEQVESVAKASGGVVTDSDREGALKRINGSGTLDELQSAVGDFYGKYAAKARSFAAADPQAFQVVAQSNPALAAVVNFGQAQQAATAAGLRRGAR